MLQQLHAGVEKIGTRAIEAVEGFGNISILMVQTFVWAVRPPYRVGVFFQSLESVGVGSLFIVMFTGLFTGLVMAYHHKQFDLTGLMFHPESVMTEYGFEMLRNWVGQ